MSTSHYALRRVAFSAFAVYLALTLVFLFVVFTPDQYFLGTRGTFALSHRDLSVNATQFQQFQQSYLAARGRDRPLLDRYLGWLAGVATLHWGYSVAVDRPVAAAVAGALVRTAQYALPGIALAVAGGVASGLYSAIREGTVGAQLGRAGVYFLFGVPGFWLASVVVALQPAATATPLRTDVVAAVVLAAGLLAGQLSVARAHSLEYASATFVTVLRAKGLRERTVYARVLHRVAVPIVALVATELLAVLLLDVYVVETVLGIDGVGRLTLTAVHYNDIPLILGTTMVVVLVGVLGSLLQDLLHGVLDPRIDLFG